MTHTRLFCWCFSLLLVRLVPLFEGIDFQWLRHHLGILETKKTDLFTHYAQDDEQSSWFITTFHKYSSNVILVSWWNCVLRKLRPKTLNRDAALTVTTDCFESFVCAIYNIVCPSKHLWLCPWGLQKQSLRAIYEEKVNIWWKMKQRMRLSRHCVGFDALPFQKQNGFLDHLENLNTNTIHAKSGRLWRYISAIFFGFSAKF